MWSFAFVWETSPPRPYLNPLIQKALVHQNLKSLCHLLIHFFGNLSKYLDKYNKNMNHKYTNRVYLYDN